MDTILNYSASGATAGKLTPVFCDLNTCRYTFNGKELDEESGMYYYSARYYAPPTFISRDKYFEKQPFMSPYAYCNNNPVKLIDPDGNFPIGMHANMVATAFSGSSMSKGALTLLKRGTSTRADLYHMDKSRVHIDNEKGTAAISAIYLGAKNSFNSEMKQENYLDAGVSLHTVADFYSHSNYIDLYQQYATENNLSMDISAIPTFSEAMENADLMQFIENNGGLKTGTFKNIVQDKLTNDPNAHGNMNLDSNNSSAGKQKYNDSGATKHDAARATAQKDLNNIANSLEN